MAFLNSFSEFFEMLFFGSNPESLKKRTLRKLESELKSLTPSMLKNRNILPPFAEGLFVLNQSCKPLIKILEETLMNTTSNVAAGYVDMLISTGFTSENCVIVKALQYENRKSAIENAENEKKEIDHQRNSLEKVIKEMNSSAQMQQIEVVITRLFQLHDICAFDFVKFIQAFAPDFNGADGAGKPLFKPAPLFEQEQRLLDLYFVIKDFSATGSLAKALQAIEEHRTASALSQEKQAEIVDNLKRISAVLTKLVTQDIIYKMLCIIKGDPKFEPEANKYEFHFIDDYITRSRQMFEANTQRIINELKDERLSAELNEHFVGKEIQSVSGYNNENSLMLQKTSTQMFMWVTPLQIMKTFFCFYFSQGIQSLLNDIVVEGFFSNTNMQSSFGSEVFSCGGIMARISEFEHSFEENQENSFSSIMRLASNSKAHPDLAKRLITKMSEVH
ncbi:MAG: hypothetical protein J5505_06755, partial [Spirochaetaceae bacterium]|nr:hypothetical protein [Spirochaetaceae bacterium]